MLTSSALSSKERIEAYRTGRVGRCTCRTTRGGPAQAEGLPGSQTEADLARRVTCSTGTRVLATFRASEESSELAADAQRYHRLLSCVVVGLDDVDEGGRSRRRANARVRSHHGPPFRLSGGSSAESSCRGSGTDRTERVASLMHPASWEKSGATKPGAAEEKGRLLCRNRAERGFSGPLDIVTRATLAFVAPRGTTGPIPSPGQRGDALTSLRTIRPPKKFLPHHHR
jgi:hypothetical protein